MYRPSPTDSRSELHEALLRHHSGCHGHEGMTALSETIEELVAFRPVDIAGDRFMEDLMKMFHNDGFFLEIDQ